MNDYTEYTLVQQTTAEYLEKDALRFGDRVLQHTVSSDNDFPGQAWADTLFMAAYFLLKLGKLIGNDQYITDALHQFTAHEELLQDPKYQGRLRIGSFSAASNVTGIKTDVKAVARLLHKYGVMACFDYAACAPYVDIDMNPEPENEGDDPSIDAIRPVSSQSIPFCRPYSRPPR